MTCTMYNNISMFAFTSHFIRLYLTCWLFEGHAKVHCTLHSLVDFSLYFARSVIFSHLHGSALTVFLCCVCLFFKYLMRSEWAISVILLVSQVRFTKKIHAFLSPWKWNVSSGILQYFSRPKTHGQCKICKYNFNFWRSIQFVMFTFFPSNPAIAKGNFKNPHDTQAATVGNDGNWLK